jgi:hypothetical protein
MKQKPIHFKKIDPKETTFFNFKLDASTYVLYDSDMGEPVSYGSFNFVSATIAKLSSKSTIFYFELNNTDGWKLKRAYKPDKTTAEDKDKNIKIENKKQETQEDKSKK